MKDWLRLWAGPMVFFGTAVVLFVLMNFPVSDMLEQALPGLAETAEFQSQTGDACTLGHVWAQRRGDVERIDATQEYVYVAYEDSIVDAYDREGNYRFTWYFRDARNGAFQIACADGLLYVESKRHTCFVFDGEQQVGTLDRLPETGERVSVTDSTVEKYDAEGNLTARFPLPEGVEPAEDERGARFGVIVTALIIAVARILEDKRKGIRK